MVGTKREKAMKKMPKDQPLSLSNREQGATAIEYGLIAALIAVAAITGMEALGIGTSASDTAPTEQPAAP